MGDCDNRNFRKGKLINLQVEEGRAESQHASPEIINTTGQIKNENIEIAGQIPSQLTLKAAVQTVGDASPHTTSLVELPSAELRAGAAWGGDAHTLVQFPTFQFRVAVVKCRVVPISGIKSRLQSNFVDLGSCPTSSKTREKLSMADG